MILLALVVFAGVMSLRQLGLAPKQEHNIRRDVAQVTIAEPVQFPVSEAVVIQPVVETVVKPVVEPVVEPKPVRPAKPVKPALRIPQEKTQLVQPVKPDIHDIDVAVFVLSRRSAFETRQVIRQTWGSGHKNVFFVVGKCCSIPPDDRKKYTCARSKSSSASSQTSWDAQCAAQDKTLANEQQRYTDIITMPEVDVYRHLPQKVKYCYKWGVKHTEAKWFVKTDDDSVVRIDTLGAYLEKTYDSNSPVVIGRISKGWGVPRSGKWAERDYKPSKYPNFPLGSVGHVVSKPVATYIADNSDKLFNYQGEDVSIGIWLHESPLKVKWVTSKRMTNHGNCKDTGMWVIGHNIKPAKMKACFAHRDEIVAPQKFNIQHISPLSLDLANRFDIIVKAVYAAELLQTGKVSDFTTNMYKKHLKVWNNFKEPCKFTGQKDWFDASKPCVKKTSAEDFIRSFQKTIQSLKKNGFDTSKSIVPVTSDLFPLNGAHRIAAAIALRMNTMPVQITSSSHSFNWDANFFIKKGFDKKYADFASTNFAMRSNVVESELSFLQHQEQNLHAVVLFPSVKNQKVNTVKTILSEDAQIITKRIFWLNKNAADMFVQQIYPNEAWVSNGAWGKTNYCFPKGTGRFPIRVLFISTSLSLDKVLDTKKKIRELYNIGKHSIHITDTRSQAMDVAKLVLNKHSLRYINHTKWTSPLQRKKIKCTKPKNVDENARFYIDGQPCALDMACGGLPRIFTKRKTYWSSVEELWFALDTANIKYALLRNFENGVIHPKDAHPDVDILLESLEPACCVMTMYGGPEAKCKRNVQNQGQHVTIGGQKVKLDIRILGDKYYGNKWIQDMLQRRVRGLVPNSIAWSISAEDYLFSLIYHVLVHKNDIPSDYPARICKKAKRLGYAMQIKQCSDRKYLEKFVSTWITPRGYRFIKPLDMNVPYNPPKVKPKEVVETRPVFAGRILTENNQLRLVNPVLCSGKTSTEILDLQKYNLALSRPKNPQKILIYKVPERKLSGGFGSRLFGIANIFMWSLLTDRTFLIDWSRLGVAFESNIVEWDKRIPTQKRFVVSLIDKTLSKKQLEGDLESAWKGHDVVEIHGASMPSEPILRKNFNYDFDSLGFVPTCSQKWEGTFSENVRRMNSQFNVWKSVMWHSLFRPSKELLALTDPITNEFDKFKRVIGVHVRLGGRIGNAADVIRIGPKCGHSCLPADFDWKQWFTNCMQTKIQMGDVAFFITSDRPKNELDALFEVANGVKVFYLPKNRIVHTDRTTDQSKTEWLETVADWLILSKTDEILMSPSSFSLTAAMYGGSVPTMLGEKCEMKPTQCAWPPPLYPNKAKTPQKYLKRLAEIQKWAENNKDSLVYLVSGGLLGMYRDGALISSDSDIDIRYDVPKKKKADFLKFKSGKLSLNALKKWGDHWNGFRYINPEDINDDFVAKFNKDLICKPLRSSPIQTHIHTRVELEYAYGPAWFIRMTFKGMVVEKYIDYVKPKNHFNIDWVKMIKTIEKIDADGDSYVTVPEINKYVIKDGIDLKQYNLQISQRDRCRASKKLSWLLEYNKKPYKIKNTNMKAMNGYHPLFDFVECDNKTV
tara:strand:- start:1470 stop:6215 length:4746 start_codon:yes stop_codon:yes gene_type:complete